jgi:RNA polymerase sigma-70 factor (ECF subfamily)
VDRYRRSHREEPLEEFDFAAKDAEPAKGSEELARLGKAVESALGRQRSEERLLLSAYYLDGRTLQQIGRLLGVHETTISRKLHRATNELRKQILRNLEGMGMSRRAAAEELGADPRDLDLNLRKLLHNSQSDAFQDKAGR